MSDKYQGLQMFNNQTERNFQNSLSSSDSVVSKIMELDKLFLDCFAILKGSENISELFFLHKTRSLFLSAVRIGLGGQSSDVYPLVRAMLESALYAWFIKQEPSRFAIWIGRLSGGDSRVKARNLFTFGNIIKEFQVAHPQMAEVVRETYDFHIDFGAHPNASGVISGIDLREIESFTELRFNLTHSWERDSFHAATKEIARTGVGALEIFRLMFPEKFKAAGFDQRIMQVMQGL